MLKVRIVEEEQTVYIDIDGYITTKEANEFLKIHKEQTRGIRNSKYNLVVNPSIFECENDEDIKKVCISLYKSGYRKVYLLDPNNYVMNTIQLSSMEKKLFTKFVKTVSTKQQIR